MSQAKLNPVNTARKLYQNKYDTNQWNSGTEPIPIVPWKEEELYIKFPKLLATNLNENFTERYNYYKKEGFLKPCLYWLSNCCNGGYHVDLVNDSNLPYAYSIGLNYWFGFPEILLIIDVTGISDSNFNSSTFRNVVIDEIANYMGENKILIDENTKLSTIFQFLNNNETTFEKATQEECNQFLDEANWFNVNFQDTLHYPCYKVRLNPKEVMELVIALGIDKIYESDNNIVHFKHEKVTTMPQTLPSDLLSLQLGKLTSMVYRVDEKEYENLVELSMDDINKFYKAAGGCDLELFKKIIEANPQHSILCKDALTFSIFNNRLDNLKYLIEIGCELKGDGNERSILMDAVQYGFEDAVKILVEAGAPLDDTDCENWTPLSISAFAILHEDLDKAKRITQYLWDKGARDM
ncbi:hypothetical protein ABK040_010184 [Willaertia magna]